MESVARVFLVGGGSKTVKYDDQTTVERVLQVVVSGIGISSVATPHFSLRLLTGLGESIWLHPYLLLRNLKHMYSKYILPSTSREELRLELRFRFIPQSAYELLLTESKAFYYLHEQVFEDFLHHVAWKVTPEAALELAALKVCRDYTEKQSKTCIDHRLGLDGIDVDSAMQKFIPQSVLHNPNVKMSSMKKQFIALLKKLGTLSPTDSVLRSLSILIEIVKFDVEVFKASMGAGWLSPIDLLIGPEAGISYRVNERCDTSKLAELRSILEITVRRMDNTSDKTIVQLKISGNAQPVLLTVATYEMAESLAHLIDGYQVMYNQSDSVFKLKGVNRCESTQLRDGSLPRLPPPSPGHSTPVERDIRIKRELVTLKELIGGGQFGNVYKGILKDPVTNTTTTVAIKVCKMENEPVDTQLILQESHLMKQFRHENIINLVGVCMDAPMWLIMELAPLGELRQYLQNHKISIDLQTLVLYCLQVARALQYLHNLQFVHRDVAARNVLVSSPNCVKLTDFGLSRALDYDAVYTASRGKLPIKWLAPESINFREFSMASDIWMYGVCLWEILSWGIKPWQGISNAEVISQIEAGARPLCPDTCPLSLYNLLERSIWALEPQKRPTMSELVKILESITNQLKQHVPVEEIRVIRPQMPVPVILTNIRTLPNLTLWRTLEEQRRQAEEDDKWLEEDSGGQDELATYDPDAENASLSHGISTISLNEKKTYMNGNAKIRKPIPLSLQRVHSATEAVTTAVSHLQNVFNKQMNHDNFVVAIRDITAKLRELFAQSTQVLNDMEDDGRRHEVEKTEALIGNDMRQLSKTMQDLVIHIDHPHYNNFRRDIVRIARELAVNCQNFYALLEMETFPGNGNQSPKKSQFTAVLTDC